MKRDFRLELPEVDPLALLDDEQARERYETAVRDAVRNESGWEVLSDAVLGQFSFQKLAMYDDYGRHATEIAEHEHCRRIAGDDSTPPPFALAIPSARETRREGPSLEAAYHPAVRCPAGSLGSGRFEAVARPPLFWSPKEARPTRGRRTQRGGACNRIGLSVTQLV